MAGELILIVEDNERNLKLVRDLLQVKGYQTLEAGTAEQGIALAAEHRPDLVLMDIQLPDLSGDQALSRLRAEPGAAFIPVVALTALAMKEDEARLLAAGFSGYITKPISSPNDIVGAPNGDLYFTDPPYGLRRPDGTFGPQEISFNGVYRIAATDGRLTVVVEDFERPNGLVISNDGRQLYIDDTERHHVRVFDLTGDGGLANGRVFVDISHGQTIGRPDGMKLDVQGNLYVAANTAEGVWVYAPDGTLLGFISVPEPPANLAWGGPGNRTLFITANTSVFRLKMSVSGQPLPIGTAP